MARVYSMPPDTNEKEKIIGGIITLEQGFYIAAGFICEIIIALVLFRFLRFFAFILGIPFVVYGFIFALKKVDNIPYPKYLKLKNKFKHKIKYYINYGNHTELNFSVYDNHSGN